MNFASFLGTKDRISDFLQKDLMLRSRSRPFLRGSVLVSQLGFGTYRVHHRVSEHHEALLVALQCGVNLIDSSTIYTDGSAETLIGNVLEEMSASGYTRDQFVIVSKLGFIQNEAQAGLWSEVVEYSPHNWYCLHPDFIRHEVNASLARLRTGGLDVMLLHNPECVLEKLGEDLFYQRLKAAFVCLESLVLEQKIRFYGISSNSFAADKEEIDRIDLEKVLKIAAEVSKSLGLLASHFQVIQFPLNPIEHQAATKKTCSWEGNGLTVLELAKQTGLDVLVNRPLNAVLGQELIRLAKKPYTEGIDYRMKFSDCLKRVQKFEDQIWKFMEGSKKLTSFVANSTDFKAFAMGTELSNMLDLLQNEDHWAEVMHSFAMLHTQKSLQLFDKVFGRDSGFDLSQFAQDYLEALGALEEAIVGFLHRREFFEVTEPLFDKFGPDFFSDAESHSAAVIRFLQDLPGKPVVLNGMRCRDYVRDATSSLIEEAHPQVSEVLSRLIRHF